MDRDELIRALVCCKIEPTCEECPLKDAEDVNDEDCCEYLIEQAKEYIARNWRTEKNVQ